MDLFGCLVFQVIGQQLSVKATRAILGRLTDRFDGDVPNPAAIAALDKKYCGRARLAVLPGLA